MSENRDVGRALHDLGVAVARKVTAPPPAAVRARAIRWRLPLRVSTTRMVVGLVAAGAVAAVVVGMTTVVRNHLAPPPIGWPSPSVPPSPSPSPSFSPSPRPTLPVPPRPSVAVTDPIASVDWDGPGRVTVVVPPHTDGGTRCPSGEVDVSFERRAPYPTMTFGWATASEQPVYGDLTGDGRPEAVLQAQCLQDEQDSGDGKGQLLVVTRDADGTLRALAWVGPRGAIYPEAWVADGTLYADARPWHTDWGYSMGDVLAYRWQGGRFVSVDSGYSGIKPMGDRPAPELDLRPVAALSGCPGGPMRIPPLPPPREDVSQTDAVTVDGYVIDFNPPTMPDGFPHYVDLAGDGRRALLVAMVCRAEGAAEGAPPVAQGVLALEPTADGMRAVDFVGLPTRYGFGGWSFDEGRLTLDAVAADGMEFDDEPYTWNGRYFQR